jgi:hypothetical protein
MLLFTGSVITTILDFWVVLVPMLIAWNLSLPIKERIGVLAMFLLGLFICACGALRTRYTYTLFHTYDESWVEYPIWILSALELDVGILCSCAPALRIVVRECLKRYRERVGGWKQRNESLSSLTHLKEKEVAYFSI